MISCTGFHLAENLRKPINVTNIFQIHPNNEIFYRHRRKKKHFTKLNIIYSKISIQSKTLSHFPNPLIAQATFESINQFTLTIFHNTPNSNRNFIIELPFDYVPGRLSGTLRNWFRLTSLEPRRDAFQNQLRIFAESILE